MNVTDILIIIIILLAAGIVAALYYAHTEHEQAITQKRRADTLSAGADRALDEIGRLRRQHSRLSHLYTHHVRNQLANNYHLIHRAVAWRSKGQRQ